MNLVLLVMAVLSSVKNGFAPTEDVNKAKKFAVVLITRLSGLRKVDMNMTKEEFIDKWGDTVVTFSHYYKYTFWYKVELGEGVVL